MFNIIFNKYIQDLPTQVLKKFSYVLLICSEKQSNTLRDKKHPACYHPMNDCRNSCCQSDV